MPDLTRRTFLEGAALVGAAAALLPRLEGTAYADTLTPFSVHFPDSELSALKARIAATRWPEQETVADDSQGIKLARLQSLADQWKSPSYDWRAVEDRINSFPNFMTNIDGLDIHFIWKRSSRNHAIPLILTHGWPGSFMEFLGVIDLLTEPPHQGGLGNPAFDVVVPSIPGFGFSGKPTTTGWGPFHVATAWAELMTRLGYDTFGVQGGDWGAFISSIVAGVFPDRVIGMHNNFPAQAMGYATDTDLTASEIQALDDAARFTMTGMGYAVEQASRPQTIGYGLLDSPVGTCGWIAEKCDAWAGLDATGSSLLSATQVLDQVTLYWLTATGASSARLYQEGGFGVLPDPRLPPPPPPPQLAARTAISIFPREIQRPSLRWCKRAFTPVLYYNQMPSGGHFAAWEQPQVFAAEVRAGFRRILDPGSPPL